MYRSLGAGGDWRDLNLIFISIYSIHTFDCNAILIIKYIFLWILYKEHVYHTIQSKLTSYGSSDSSASTFLPPKILIIRKQM